MMNGVLIRKIQEADFAAMLAIINDAAQTYRGVIPADRWREPYMPSDELVKEIADGVLFWGAEQDGCLLGVMGMQDKGEVILIRHAYVLPSAQGGGIGTRLLRHVADLTSKPILVGTWAAAIWAIEFYRRRGFTLVSQQHKDILLHKYWSIPERQMAASVVLADICWMKTQNDLAEN
jgi:N-acetylglutamate synthase-like GNAT family acetyltransferase